MTVKSALLLFTILNTSLFAQLNWQQTNGPYGGNFQDIKIDKNGKIYAATYGGVVRSDDKGKTWQNEKLVSFGGPNTYVIFPHPSGKILAGLGSNLMTTDFKGQNWKFTYNDIWVWDIKTDNKNNLFLVSNKGVLVSADTARTWNSFIKLQYIVFDFAVLDDSLYFAASSQGLYISRDGRKTWTLNNLGLGQNLWWVKIIADSRNNLYLFSQNASFKSSDKGLTWTQLQPAWESVIAVSINSKDEVFVSGKGGLYSSKDYGSSWTNQNFTGEAHCFYESSEGTQYLGTNAHLYNRAAGSIEWVRTDTGLLKSAVRSVKVNNNDLFVIANGEFLYSPDYGDTWLTSMKEQNYFSKIFYADSKGRVYAGYNNKILVTSDKGLNWNELNTDQLISNQPDISYPSNIITSIIADNRDRVYLATRKEIYSTSDFGISWEKLWSSDLISDIVLELDNIGNLYFGHAGMLYVYSIDDAKLNLVKNFAKGIYALKLSPFGQVYVNCDFKILRKGINNDWDFIHDAGDSKANINFSSTGELYLWSMWLFKSLDFGSNFVEVPTPLITGFYRTDFNLTGSGVLFFATEVEGLFRLKTIPEAINAPRLVKMYYNFPNPFNDQTNLSFENSEQSIVSLSVYDILGRKVETVVNEILPIGYYRYMWQPKNLASGIYFYRLQTPSFSETKKMIYLK